MTHIIKSIVVLSAIPCSKCGTSLALEKRWVRGTIRSREGHMQIDYRNLLVCPNRQRSVLNWNHDRKTFKDDTTEIIGVEEKYSPEIFAD